VQFLKELSDQSSCQALVLTVPYVGRSRVGMHHIRHGSDGIVTPEETHVFELCPADWILLVKHAGWSPIEQRVYLQYPSKHPLRVLKGYWKRIDFEGFWGVILRRDRTWKQRYSGW